ncbi:MAG: M28 family peptidase [Candidatus Lokiarchaeota archaeon]|nr:M28 family peptidase [Candidatus Lokiarchaeota archaeon]MBD3199290.1 M28 family peptidase [Candidatus Lokiarchaeota archaeon]
MDNEIDNSIADYMYNFIEDICNKFGPRYSCSDQEKEANKWIKQEFESYCDETYLDEFETRPNLYPQGLVKVAGLLSGISPFFIPLIYPFPILSSILIFLGLFILVSELIFMKEWIWFLFRKKKSSNVIGVIKPVKETKFRIIFEGHTDSAKEMNIASMKEKNRYLIAVLGFIFILSSIVFSIWKFIALTLLGSNFILFQWSIFSITIIDYIYLFSAVILYPFFILLVKGFLGKSIVLGANDNLAGTAVVAGLGKVLSNNRLDNVEVWICSQGSEEVGDKGARAFVEKYGGLGHLDDSYSIVLECCGAADAILLVEKDMHGIVYNKEINKKLKDIHTQIKESNPDMLDLRVDKLKIGACDVVRYIENGYKATALFGVEKTKNKAVNWHSKEDVPRNIDKKVLSDFLKICLKFIEDIDSSY